MRRWGRLKAASSLQKQQSCECLTITQEELDPARGSHTIALSLGADRESL